MKRRTEWPRSPEYNCWVNLKSRCYNKNRKCYKNYGGRGISVCERWLNSYSNFINDMGPRPSKKHSLDRIDNNGHYEPSNCRWVTSGVQARNCRKRIRKNNIPYVGVYPVFRKGLFSGKYKAKTYIGDTVVYLGTFPSAVLAALENDRFKIKNNNFHGLNFPWLTTKPTDQNAKGDG